MDPIALIRSPQQDPALVAYAFRKLCRETPQRALEHTDELLAAFRRFDPRSAEALVDEVTAPPAERLVPLVRRLVAADDRPVVRARSVFRLTELDRDPPTVALLASLLGSATHPRVRAACLSGLARLRVKTSLRKIKPHLLDGDPRVRASAVELTLVQDVRGLGTMFTILLNDESPRVKALAATGLWRLGSPVLMDLIRDVELPGHRVSLLHALGHTGRDAQARRILTETLESEDGSVREMALKTLCRMAETADIPPLLARGVRMPGRKVKEDLTTALERVDAAHTARVLHTMVERAQRRRDPRELASLIRMVGTLRTRLDVDQMVPYMDSADPRVRSNALECVGARIPPGERRSLLPALGSESPRVRATAAMVLWRAGFHAAMGELRRMVQHASSAFRASAVHALGRVGGLLAETALEKALQDPEDRIRRLAFEALGGGADVGSGVSPG